MDRKDLDRFAKDIGGRTGMTVTVSNQPLYRKDVTGKDVTGKGVADQVAPWLEACSTKGSGERPAMMR